MDIAYLKHWMGILIWWFVWIMLFLAVAPVPRPALAMHVPDGVRITDIYCSIMGMNLQIEVDEGFYGIIFAERNFFNTACRYHQLQEFKSSFRLFLPQNNCDTKIEKRNKDLYFSNRIVVQKKPFLQSALDAIRNVSCKVDIASDKYLSYEVRYESEEIKSWMDFEQGFDTASSNSTRIVTVGETFSLTVHHENSRGGELRVKKCWVHDSLEIERSKLALPIFDAETCRPSEYLLEPSFGEEILNGSHIIKMQAFKFQESLNVYFTCTVEVCSEECNDLCFASKIGNHHEANRLKRAVPNGKSRSFEERVRLMKATIKALGKTIIDRQSKLPPVNDTDFNRRALDHDDNKIISSHIKYADDDTDDAHDDIDDAHDDIDDAYDDIDDAYDDIDDAYDDIDDAHDDIDDSFSMTGTVGVRIPALDDFRTKLTTTRKPVEGKTTAFNLTRGIIILPLGHNILHKERFQLLSYFGSNLRFVIAISILGVVVFLLLLVSITLAIALRHERRRQRAENMFLNHIQ